MDHLQKLMTMKRLFTHRDSESILLRMADYARLRELAGGRPLADELDRAIGRYIA